MADRRRSGRAEADRSVHERLAGDAAREKEIRAPAGLLDRVMEAVYRESLRGSPALEEPAAAARAYRRIGWSFVLSAALVAAALVAPSGFLPAAMRTDGVERALGAGEQSVVRNVLTGADAVVRAAIRPATAPASATRGGISR